MMSDIANKTNFELVSPEEKLVSKQAYMVTVPGDDGEFAAMPGSASLLSSLKPGLVKVYVEDREESSPDKIFITGGFADVSGEQCTILAESAQNLSDLDQADIEQTIRNLQEDLGMAKETKEKNKILEKLELQKAKLEAITGKAITSL